jgi:hypothetical protein
MLPKSRKSPAPPAPKKSALDLPYMDGDSIPAPDVVERASESVWALWSDVEKEHEVGFAETQPAARPTEDPQYATTQPMGLPSVMDTRPPGEAPRPGSGLAASLDFLMVTARRNNRVCPRPERWKELYEALGGQHAMHLPAPPLDPQAWAAATPLQKRLLLREQLEWAQRQGKLEKVAAFMNRLQEADWSHMDDR